MPCELCEGTGSDFYVIPGSGRGVFHTCPACKGTGRKLPVEGDFRTEFRPEVGKWELMQGTAHRGEPQP